MASDRTPNLALANVAERAVGPAPSRLDAMRAKLAAAEKARDIATASITEDERAEIEIRAATARADEEREAAERAKRDLDLARRAERAIEAAPHAKITTFAPQGYSDTFVLQFMSHAHAAWQTAIQAKAQNKAVDIPDTHRKFAAACVIDWNGIVDFNGDAGHRLNAFLKEHGGIVTGITLKLSEFSGVIEAEKKG